MGEPAGEWAEALRRASVLWVGVPGQPERPVWHASVDGEVYVLAGAAGSGEQELAGLDAAGEVLLSLATGAAGALVAVLRATVHEVAAGSPEWDAALPALLARRLNRPDAPEQAAARWAGTCRLYRLHPQGPAVGAPGRFDATPRRRPVRRRSEIGPGASPR